MQPRVACTAPRVETVPASILEQRTAAALADGHVRLGRATWESAVPAATGDAAARPAVSAPASCSRACRPSRGSRKSRTTSRIRASFHAPASAASSPRRAPGAWRARPRPLLCATATMPSSLPAPGRRRFFPPEKGHAIQSSLTGSRPGPDPATWGMELRHTGGCLLEAPHLAGWKKDRATPASAHGLRAAARVSGSGAAPQASTA